MSLINRKLSNASPPTSRNQLVERCSTLRGCEPCKRRKRICNGARPCAHCIDEFHDCVYSVVSDHPRNVFTTNTARRLSSGSACKTCRRRKTKCDGNSPCGFCASNGIACINNSERRKRSMVASSCCFSSSSPSNIPTTSSSLATSSDNSATTSTSTTDIVVAEGGGEDHEAIDRIEDRLKRIEKLMTAFTPSPLSQSPLTKEINELKYAASGFRKLSSPHLQHSRSPHTTVRQQRHSIHNLSSSSSSSSSSVSSSSSLLKRERYELHRNNASALNSDGSNNKSTSATNHNISVLSSPSPPLSPHTLKQSSSSQHASSTLNLSLSPSSSSTSCSSFLQPSFSTPTNQWNHNASTLQKEWKQASPIPSLMDQLSKCTFVATAMDYTTVHYPIYPITPPFNSKNMEESP